MGIDPLARRVPSIEFHRPDAELGHVDAVGHGGTFQELIQLQAVVLPLAPLPTTIRSADLTRLLQLFVGGR